MCRPINKQQKRCYKKLCLEKTFCDGFPFFLERKRWSLFAGLTIPIIGIAYIAFYPVQVGMDMCRLAVGEVLDEFMGLVPLVVGGIPERLLPGVQVRRRHDFRQALYELIECHRVNVTENRSFCHHYRRVSSWALGKAIFVLLIDPYPLKAVCEKAGHIQILRNSAFVCESVISKQQI